jgi:hypothetical protein
LGGQAVTRPVRAGVGPLALFTQRVVRQLHYLVKTFLVGQSQMIFVEDWDVGAGGEYTSAAREEIETFGYSVNYRKRTCSDGVSQQN